MSDERVELSAGPIHYRVLGPADSAAPPVLFVHGLLVDGELWAGVAERLAGAGVRSYRPDWPLGSHREALGGELSPTIVARLILEFVDTVGLRDVTIVGNDTGGAICQLAIDADDNARITRAVFTNCDTDGNFPPPLFRPLFRMLRSQRLIAALQRSIRPTALRHSPLAYGMLLNHPIDPALTARWVEPLGADAGIRADLAAFARGFDAKALAPVVPRLRTFPGPVRVAWGMRDRNFGARHGQALAAAFSRGAFEPVTDATTFVSVDRPDEVADAIRTVQGEPADGHDTTD